MELIFDFIFIFITANSIGFSHGNRCHNKTIFVAWKQKIQTNHRPSTTNLVNWCIDIGKGLQKMSNKSFDQDEELLAVGHSKTDSSFDDAITALEEIVFNAEFSKMQDEFFERHCRLFQDEEENRLCYTEIFNNYGKLLDDYLCSQLKDKLPNFNLDSFACWLLSHENEISGELVELVHSTTDFLQFKETMLSYKKKCKESSTGEREREQRNDNFDLCQSFSIRSCKMN